MPTLTIPQAFDLALSHHQAGRLAEAEQLYRHILSAAPRHADALHMLGLLAQQVGRHDAAVECIRQALALIPDRAAWHSNLGEAHRSLGQLDAAIAAHRRAVELDPNYAVAWSNLGNVLWAAGQFAGSVAACHRAVALKPEFAEAHSNLGNALKGQGRLEDAIAAYRHALRLAPNLPEAHNNLGGALAEAGKPGEAIAVCRRALQLRPGMAIAHNNLGNALKDCAQMDEAIAAYRRALELQPDSAKFHSNLLMSLHYPSRFGAEAIFAEHCQWDEIHARPLRAGIAPHANVAEPGRRLRVGYVSPDFCGHPVAVFLEGLLENHDRAQCEIFCYACLPAEDRVTARLRRLAAHWRDFTGLADARAAEVIREDRIDILVDLAGHTAGNRLMVFARKPAPVQVTCLGYCDTTGMKVMDFRLTDALADPPGVTERLHTERLVRLPDCAWCFRPPDEAPPIRAAPVSASGHVTFGCFNMLSKLNETVLGLWSRILSAVPRSRLLLKNHGLREPSANARIRAALEQAGVAPARVEIHGATPGIAEHLAAYGRMDIALDTFPYHGTTTTCEALWMGVPVVTLAGKTHASRVGVSLLTNVGLPELIAENEDDYIRVAAQLAANIPRLAELRATLRGKMASSPLMDAPRFARNVEAAYRAMWRAWCAGRGGT